MAEVIGTNVIAPIVPLDSLDTYPTHIAEYGKGGWRSVASIQERDNISPDRLEVGMAVYVLDIDKEYSLVSIETMEWRERVFGTSGGGTGEDIYKVELLSSNGTYVKKTENMSDVLTVLSAHVYLGQTEVTAQLLSNRFIWKRVSISGYEEEDQIWNDAHYGGFKSINVTSGDLHKRATFTCYIY